MKLFRQNWNLDGFIKIGGFPMCMYIPMIMWWTRLGTLISNADAVISSVTDSEHLLFNFLTLIIYCAGKKRVTSKENENISCK